MINFDTIRRLIDEGLARAKGPKVTMDQEVEACIACIGAVETGTDRLHSPAAWQRFQATRQRFHTMTPIMLPVPVHPQVRACPICGTVDDAPRHRMKLVETYHARPNRTER